MLAKPLGARAKGACILRTTPKMKWEKVGPIVTLLGLAPLIGEVMSGATLDHRAGLWITFLKRERGGSLRHQTSKERSIGKTEQWEVTRRLFDFHANRLGFKRHEKSDNDPPREIVNVQPSLF